MCVLKSRLDSVDKGTIPRVRRPLFPGRGSGFSSTERPDRLWTPHRLVYNGYWNSLAGEKSNEARS